ncbi:capsule biosynthesis protein [Tranquillimonas alkanivorans]|uniref:Capsular polysaccharide transport system permease protein n=1 Tax=Tranquillimonas alkanivorans TaxID=441119 RepID=A0A1I5MFF4_9RHOB|nr:capsule biosynthesis protein [Tranquillimonas alkanivorans]SFP08037.1 capsular polysaccharide transport system permease protein [Tranquillimonas alkanivorans]
MTTNSRPKKYRIRRSSALAQGVGAGRAVNDTASPEATARVLVDGSMALRSEPGSAPTDPPHAAGRAERDAADAIEEIRREGLTGRQLRMARRLANKHGLSPANDLDAVRLLRDRGIDPFERANLLELVVADRGSPDDEARVQLPQTVDRGPGTDVGAPAAPYGPPGRAREILEIQRDIARRRRRKLALLFTRLAFFVGLPTLLAGYYYYAMATPMYATQSEFVIQQADNAQAGALGGLFSGTGLATSQDSITVQSYLTSRDAMLRLDDEAGFKSHFSDPSIDPIQRLPEQATNEQAYDLYQDNVKIGYDPTEGIIKMEVVAADPEVSAEYSRRLISYAEEQVDRLTQRLREDQMQGARESFEEAEAKMAAAQARVLALQEELGVLDPTSESSTVFSQIATFETQLREKRLELAQLTANERPNQARVAGVRGDIQRLESVVEELRAELTEGSDARGSLASVTAQLRVAEVDLQTRTLMMQQALQQLETARVEANRQVRYLSTGVSPVPPDEPTYPRAFENTILAFLIFSGIYLMISLTASVLREQVTS